MAEKWEFEDLTPLRELATSPVSAAPASCLRAAQGHRLSPLPTSPTFCSLLSQYLESAFQFPFVF